MKDKKELRLFEFSTNRLKARSENWLLKYLGDFVASLKNYADRRGLTLTELALAVFILALAFIPIVGVLGNSIQGTQKDEQIIKAVQLAQSSLNSALQFPFKDLVTQRFGANPGAGPWQFSSVASVTISTGTLSFTFGDVQVGRYSYNVSLQIVDECPTFTVKICDPMKKGGIASTTPSAWGWNDYNSQPYSDFFHRYSLTVTWVNPSHKQCFYSLVSYKAKLEE